MTPNSQRRSATKLLRFGFLLVLVAMGGYLAGFLSGQASVLQPGDESAVLAIEAVALRKEAAREVKVVRTYFETTSDKPRIYKDVLDLNKKMEDAYGRRNWRKVIASAAEIRSSVPDLLQPLQRQALQDLELIESQFQRLIDEGGETYAPIHVSRVKKLKDDAKDSIRYPYLDFAKALALEKQAMLSAQEGIIEAKKKRCEGLIAVLEKELISAKQLNAESSVPDLWSATSQDLARLVESFQKKEYDFVLAVSVKLKNQVEVMVHEARKVSAKSRIDELTRRLTELRTEDFETRVPDYVKEMEEALEDAKGCFASGDYSDADAIVRGAMLTAAGGDPVYDIDTTGGSLKVRILGGIENLRKIHGAQIKTIQRDK